MKRRCARKYPVATEMLVGHAAFHFESSLSPRNICGLLTNFVPDNFSKINCVVVQVPNSWSPLPPKRGAEVMNTTTTEYQ
jgi:hypothetical protein